MAKSLNLIGKRFERLVVMSRTTNDCHGNSRWNCKCDCGNDVVVVGTQLTSGHTKSCGCYAKDVARKNLPDNSTHHLSRTPLYRSWVLMKQRCFNNQRKDWNDYGGRGIAMCEEWLSSDNFFDWALRNGYENGKTLDRIDVDGNYTPENCRWATAKEQGRNKRNNISVNVNDCTYVLSELAEKFNVPYATIWQRYRCGDRGDRLVRPVDVKYRPKVQ